MVSLLPEIESSFRFGRHHGSAIIVFDVRDQGRNLYFQFWQQIDLCIERRCNLEHKGICSVRTYIEEYIIFPAPLLEPLQLSLASFGRPNNHVEKLGFQRDCSWFVYQDKVAFHFK